MTLWLTCPQDFLLLLSSSFLWVPRNSLWAPYSRYPLTPILVTSYEMQSCWYDSKMTTDIWLQIRIWTKTYSNSSLQDTDNWPVFQACALQSWKMPDNILCCSWYQLNEPLATRWLDLHNNCEIPSLCLIIDWVLGQICWHNPQITTANQNTSTANS